jgi:simple sugar transport system substrate-binding protein
LLGPQFVEAVQKLVAGETLPKITYSIEYVYDDSNAAKELPNRQY